MWQVLGLEALAAPLLQFLAVVSLLFGGQELGNQLVATLADLTADCLDIEIDSSYLEGILPCCGVKPVALNEGAIDIAQYGFDHEEPPRCQILRCGLEVGVRSCGSVAMERTSFVRYKT